MDSSKHVGTENSNDKDNDKASDKASDKPERKSLSLREDICGQQAYDHINVWEDDYIYGIDIYLDKERSKKITIQCSYKGTIHTKKLYIGKRKTCMIRFTEEHSCGDKCMLDDYPPIEYKIPIPAGLNIREGLKFLQAELNYGQYSSQHD